MPPVEKNLLFSMLGVNWSYPNQQSRNGGIQMLSHTSSNRLIIFFILFTFMTLLSSVAAAENGFTLYGDIGQIALPVAALGMTIAKGDKEGAIEFAEAFVTTEALTYGLKYTINEKRPNGGKHSFPSGHTSSAFAGAAFLQERYGWDYGIPAYVAAAAVGASRITSHKHHVQDVIAGAAIGTGSNLIFTKEYKKNAVAIAPAFLNGGAGLMFSYSFK